MRSCRVPMVSWILENANGIFGIPMEILNPSANGILESANGNLEVSSNHQ